MREINHLQIVTSGLHRTAGPYNGKEQGAAVARVEDVSAQSCRRDCIDRPVCGSDDLVSAAVRVTDPEARAPRNPAPFGNCASQCGMDKSATDGGLWLGGEARLSRARSGQRLRRGLHPARSGDGHSGLADRAPGAVAEWLL